MINSSSIFSFAQHNQASRQTSISPLPSLDSLPLEDISNHEPVNDSEIIAILQGYINPTQAHAKRSESPTSITRDIFVRTPESNLPATQEPLPVLDTTPLEQHVELDLEGIRALFQNQQIRTPDQQESDPANHFTFPKLLTPANETTTMSPMPPSSPWALFEERLTELQENTQAPNTFQAFQYPASAHHPTPTMPGNKASFRSPFLRTGKQFPNDRLTPKASPFKKSKYEQKCEEQIKEALQNPPEDKKSLAPFLKKALIQQEYYLQDNSPSTLANLSTLATLSQEYAVNPRQLQRWLNSYKDPVQA